LYSGHAECVKLLLNAGANPCLLDDNGGTPLVRLEFLSRTLFLALSQFTAHSHHHTCLYGSVRAGDRSPMPAEAHSSSAARLPPLTSPREALTLDHFQSSRQCALSRRRERYPHSSGCLFDVSHTPSFTHTYSGARSRSLTLLCTPITQLSAQLTQWPRVTLTLTLTPSPNPFFDQHDAAAGGFKHIVESLLAVSAEAGMHTVQDNDGDSPLVR